MSQKSDKARYTYAFASDLQELAEEKRIKVAGFNVSKRKSKLGSYDFLTVNFIVPRPDRDKGEEHIEDV